ncbi:unnamed protein product [Rhizoctonia solani]|uniref:Uncharacterized protein n=1 Tax=Rhizoctonia solani TaxID=456999 RepID=A0A8H2X942_9AGAM|nr:unnamed protein product [Rhizoctonia solani]CAE6420520.1 unnamed protein product [Rhizoctonia solani]
MNIDAGVVKHPRRLAVVFSCEQTVYSPLLADESHLDNTYDMVLTNDGDRSQLVHAQYDIKQPSRLVRFATRFRLTTEDQPMMDVVEKAHAFVTGNYGQGDQVTLYVDRNSDRFLDAAEMLAKHLYNGTRPGDPLKVQPNNGGKVRLKQIPIQWVMPLLNYLLKQKLIMMLELRCGPWYVQRLGEKSSVSERNDELKSRFPPGIEHIICWGDGNGFRSCATKYDADGGMISREMCISRGDSYNELRRYCTKHVIYYYEARIPKWDNDEPVWTHKLDSSPADVQAALPFEVTKPLGMYLHELRKYQHLPGVRGDGSTLVWKSYRSAGEYP